MLPVGGGDTARGCPPRLVSFTNRRHPIAIGFEMHPGNPDLAANKKPSGMEGLSFNLYNKKIMLPNQGRLLNILYSFVQYLKQKCL